MVNPSKSFADFHLLEDISREADAAKRIREPFGPERYRMTPNMAALMKQAKNRNISLLFLAQGMTRRQANTSYFQKKYGGAEVGLAREVHEVHIRLFRQKSVCTFHFFQSAFINHNPVRS